MNNARHISPCRILRIAAAALLLAVALAGCKKEDVVIDEEFSINVFQISPKWPVVDKLPQVEKEVLLKYGKPDCFRAWWTPDGQLRTRQELSKEVKIKKLKSLPAFSWIYTSTGKEVVFRGSTYQEVPLTDQVRTVVKYGDPEDAKEMVNGVVEWTYFSVGKIYRFARGHKISEKDFPPMGSFRKL